MTATSGGKSTTSFIWLELTGRCQLNCVHCYADSGPTQGHGTMATDDWLRIIDQAAEHGVAMVSMIGGEPTSHPDFADLLEHALAMDLEVEVFTNLFHVADRLWTLFSLPGVRLATSYYSDDPVQHDTVTGRPGSYTRTRQNIAQAVVRRIPIRVGIIGLADAQRTDQARRELEAIGVPAEAIGYDALRAFGRGAQGLPNEADTCGKCGHSTAAVLPDGTVAPCVFTRTAKAGSVLASPLGDVLSGDQFAEQVARLDTLRQRHASMSPCTPNLCNPQCGPTCSPACTPCGPGNCQPTRCAPQYSCGPCSPQDRTCSPDNNCRPNQCRPSR